MDSTGLMPMTRRIVGQPQNLWAVVHCGRVGERFGYRNTLMMDWSDKCSVIVRLSIHLTAGCVIGSL